MDYNELSQEYFASAEALQETINRLEKRRDNSERTVDRIKLGDKILEYKIILYDMIDAANLLKQREENNKMFSIIIDNYVVNSITDKTVNIRGYRGNLSEITIPSTLLGGRKVTSIGARAFAKNTSLKSVTLPDTIVSIGSGAFFSSSIEKVELGANTAILGSNAFYNCDKLEILNLGNALTAVAGYTFNRCSSLTRVDLPKSVKSIGEYAFFRCVFLEYILIPPSVTEIAENAFDECNCVTIYGESDSYARQYAVERHIPFRTSSTV